MTCAGLWTQNCTYPFFEEGSLLKVGVVFHNFQEVSGTFMFISEEIKAGRTWHPNLKIIK